MLKAQSEARYRLRIAISAYPPAFDVPVKEYRHDIWYGKTRMVGLPNGEKNFDNMFIHFGGIHKRDGDRRTHTQRETDRHDGIGRAYA